MSHTYSGACQSYNTVLNLQLVVSLLASSATALGLAEPADLDPQPSRHLRRCKASQRIENKLQPIDHAADCRSSVRAGISEPPTGKLGVPGHRQDSQDKSAQSLRYSAASHWQDQLHRGRQWLLGPQAQEGRRTGVHHYRRGAAAHPRRVQAPMAESTSPLPVVSAMSCATPRRLCASTLATPRRCCCGQDLRLRLS